MPQPFTFYLVLSTSLHFIFCVLSLRIYILHPALSLPSHNESLLLDSTFLLGHNWSLLIRTLPRFGMVQRCLETQMMHSFLPGTVSKYGCKKAIGWLRKYSLWASTCYRLFQFRADENPAGPCGEMIKNSLWMQLSSWTWSLLTMLEL